MILNVVIPRTRILVFDLPGDPPWSSTVTPGISPWSDCWIFDAGRLVIASPLICDTELVSAFRFCVP
ncbi:hypothetical protein D3C87_1887700 [compost metagenome]